MSKKWKLIIEIDGESADNLFLAGPKDLKEYFLPEFLNVKEEDIVKIHFIEDVNPEEFKEWVQGKRDRGMHGDNYGRSPR